MNKNFYVTTPIFYPTGLPHIGTAYNVFVADTLARYYRAQGYDTFFLTGTDEHGGNIADKAAAAVQTPQEYVDSFAAAFKEIWKDLNISNDFFIQTTDPKHEKFAADLIQKAYDNGDIYEGEYSGWYCDSCEAYYQEEDLIEGKCPNHPKKEARWTTEKNYFFKWSKYQDWLLEFYEQNPNFVTPVKWFDYVKGLVKAGIKDIPVTRANVKWGVQVPFDKEQTIYVWYDALPNYLSVLGFPDFKKKKYEDKFWPEATHVVGKDIIKFHAILWPAMLKSVGLEPPKQVVVHGFFTVNGAKIGKSNDNAIDPRELTKKYGIDAVRYALLSEFKIGNDGDFSEARLEVKYQSDLAANWGNLHNRVVHLATKLGISTEKPDFAQPEIQDTVEPLVIKYHEHFAQREIFEAIQDVYELASWANKYVSDKRPWELEDDHAKPIVHNLVYILHVLAELYAPILPETAAKARESLQKGEKVILFPQLV